MKSRRQNKWGIDLGIAAAVLGAAFLVVAWWLPSDEEFAARLKAEAEQRLGVKVTIGSAHWALLPTPVAVVSDFRTQQEHPVVIGQLSARPNVSALLQRKLAFRRIDIADAVFPRNSIVGFAKPGASGLAAGDVLPLQHFEFRNVTWIDYGGTAVAYDGEIDFDVNWRPRQAELRRPGANPPFTLTLNRDGAADRWQARILVGGGSADGSVEFKAPESGPMQLNGHLQPHDIDVVSALSTFNRRSPIGGKASGQTVLSAEAASVGELARSLHTRSLLHVTSARILRLDLDKAISTLGKEHDGQTALQELTGQLDTQNGKEGMRVTYSNLKARHDKYTAHGEATIYHHHVEANGTLDLVDGAIGVPFTVSGPLDKPKASVPPAFFAGAAVGTAVLPGIGTLIGARIGGSLGRIFKGGATPPSAPTMGATTKH